MRRFGFWRHIGTALIVAAITIALCETVAFLALRILQPPSALAIYRDRLVSGGRVASVKAMLDQRWRTAEFDVAVRTNSNGYREDFDFALADVEFAFMGDSFTFGHGVEASERYTNLFAARLKGKIDPARVVSLGGNNGFQPEHYEYFLKKNPELRPKHLVIGLYLGNDLEPDVRETRFDRASLTLDLPNRAVDQGAVINAAPYRVPFFREQIRLSRTARLTAILLNRSIWRSYLFEADAAIPNAYNSDALDLGELNEFSNRAFDSLLNIRDLVRRRGGDLVVLVIPQNFYAGAVAMPHLAPGLWPRASDIRAQGGLRAAVANRCKAMELDCIDAGDAMTPQDFFSADAHWTRDGHRKAAELLYRYFLENERL